MCGGFVTNIKRGGGFVVVIVKGLNELERSENSQVNFNFFKKLVNKN
jgi:hypothetical protein